MIRPKAASANLQEGPLANLTVRDPLLQPSACAGTPTSNKLRSKRPRSSDSRRIQKHESRCPEAPLMQGKLPNTESDVGQDAAEIRIGWFGTHFFKPACQFNTTVMDEGAPALAELIKNRWPSGAASQRCPFVTPPAPQIWV